MAEWTSESNGVAFSIFDRRNPSQPPPAPEVYRSQEGVGYPSCSRMLALIPPNQNDANGYYALLGVDPWATEDEIKSALRRLKLKVHPDNPANVGADQETMEANLRLFMRLQEVSEVLLDPIHRANYNSIPPGRKLIDSQVAAEMEDAGITGEDPGVQKFAVTPEDMGAADRKGRERSKERLWDYMATNHNELDLINAQEWYSHLIRLAPMFRYEGTIKVLLHDGRGSAWKKEGSIMLIPRTWEPDAALAFAMFRRHIGWPKFEARYKERPQQPVGFVVNGWSGTGNSSSSGLLSVYPTHVTPTV